MRVPILLLLAASIGLPIAIDGEETGSSIGYETVAEALDALQSNPKASISISDGWTLVQDRSDGQYTLWSFTPTTHPAHPAAIKRVIVKEEGAIYIRMTALCQAEKTECDQLIDEFKVLNDKIRASMNAGQR